METQNKFDLLRNQILMKTEKGIAQDEDVLRNLFQTTDPELIGNEEFLISNIVHGLCEKGQIKESLLFFGEALKKYPHHLALNHNYRIHLAKAVAELESIGCQDVASFQFRSLYELLKDLGVLSFKCHNLAVEHYRQNDCHHIAKAISKNLSLIAPNYHGIK
jgi:hypothetical protein